jgi:hypothetical protein
MNLELNSRVLEVRWSKGSCGTPGCKDPECVCALCAQPIGTSEEDPRWDSHPDYCCSCQLCEDQVPIILFHGDSDGREMRQAALHARCFQKLCEPDPEACG